MSMNMMVSTLPALGGLETAGSRQETVRPCSLPRGGACGPRRPELVAKRSAAQSRGPSVAVAVAGFAGSHEF